MSLLFVDSNCDLNISQLKKLGLECIYIPYSINDNKMIFDENFDYNKFYSKTRKDVVVSSIMPSYDEYIKIFSSVLEGDDIVYIHSSMQLHDYKVLYDVRTELLNKYPNRRFELIDSKNISIGQGVLSYLLAREYRNGATIDELISISEDLRNKIALYAVVDDLECLSNHNLIDSSKVVGSSLNIKFIIAMDIDGKIQVIDKVSGRKKAINKLIKIIRQQGENVVDHVIGVSYCSNNMEISLLESKIKEYFEDAQLLSVNISPANVAILGNNTVCIVFNIHSKIH